MAYTGRLRPEGGPFSGSRYMRVASPTVEVCGRVGTSVISVILSTPRGRVLPTLWSKRGGSARKGDLFFRRQVHERVGRPTVEVCGRVGTSVISIVRP